MIATAYKKSELLRQRIFKEATKLFYENGFQDTPMLQIAKACEIRQSLLYYYFPNKFELAQELLKGFTAQMHKVLGKHMTYDQFPVFYMFTFVRLLVKELSKDPKELRFYCEIYNMPDPDRPFASLVHQAVQKYRPDLPLTMDQTKV